MQALHAEGPLSRSELGGAHRADAQRHPPARRRAVAAGLVVEERGELARDARPAVAARPPRSRTAPSSWRWRSPSTRWPWPSSGSAVTSSSSPASIGRAATSTPERHRRRPRRARRRRRPTSGGTRRSSASASRSSASSAATTASSPRRRTSAGATSPLGERARSAHGARGAVAVANEADLGALAEHRRGAAAGPTT